MALGRHHGGTKSRGRSKIQGNDATIGNKGAVQLEKRTEATRPVTAGGGKNRGDRRDMDPQFTGNARKRSNTGETTKSRPGARRAH